MQDHSREAPAPLSGVRSTGQHSALALFLETALHWLPLTLLCFSSAAARVGVCTEQDPSGWAGLPWWHEGIPLFLP